MEINIEKLTYSEEDEDWKNFKELLEKTKIKKFKDLFEIAGSEKLFEYLSEKYIKIGKEFIQIYPKIKELCLDFHNLFPEGIEILHTSENKKISLTRKQIACLISLSFFGYNLREYNDNFNSFDVNYLIQHPKYNIDKILCYISYMTTIGELLTDEKNKEILEEKVTFYRNSIPYNQEIYAQKNIKLCELKLIEKGSMTDSKLKYQIDFANKYIGGGVLSGGKVQEEIMFTVRPECVAALLFMEVMDECDSIRIDNTKTYIDYTGYGSSFEFKGRKNILLQKETSNILAIDANVMPYYQFNDELINRDIHKSYTAFKLAELDNNLKEVTVATGNWGCGCFGGNHELKFLQQWISASFAGVKLLEYYSFEDIKMNNVIKYWKKIGEKFINADKLYNNLINISSECFKSNDNVLINLLTVPLI